MKALPEEGAPGAQAAALHLPASKWGVAGTRALPDLQAKERATAVQTEGRFVSWTQLQVLIF